MGKFSKNLRHNINLLRIWAKYTIFARPRKDAGVVELARLESE